MRNQNFSTFCPMVRAMRKLGRHSMECLQSFFRGYIFVELDLERQQWRSINGTIGVARLVSFGANSRPTPLPIGLVEQLKGLCEPDDELAFDDRLLPGDHVRVMSGLFAELCGVLQSASNHERVTILLNILSRETPVELSAAVVARAA